MNKKLITIFIVAFFVRLINLNQSFWLDETITARVIRQYSHLEIITKFSPFDFHPPLYYLFMKSWSMLFGFSETALRIPSVLFSLLTGYVIYFIVGFWGVVFFLFNPLIVYYSQEARPYMMVTFLLTGGLYYLIKLLSSSQINKLQEKKYLFFLNFFLILAFFTFYGSIFFIAAIWLWLLYKKQYKYLIHTTLYLLPAFLVVTPLLSKQLVNAKITLAFVKNWSMTLGKANIKNLLLIPVKFSIGRIDFYPKKIYYLIAGLWTGFILYQISKIKKQNDKLTFKKLYYFLLIIPLVLGFLVSFVTPMLQYFRFLYLIPLIAIILALNTKDAPIIRIFVTTGFLVFSLIYLFIPYFHREDWKGLVKNLPKNQQIFMIASSADPIFYYNSKTKIDDLLQLDKKSLSQKFIVIPYTTEIYGYNYQDILKKKNYHLQNKVFFRDLNFEQWNKK